MGNLTVQTKAHSQVLKLWAYQPLQYPTHGFVQLWEGLFNYPIPVRIRRAL